MVTLIDNLELNEEEREWYERIAGLPPLTIKISQWVNLEGVIDGISTNLREDDIHILVATGGVEVYKPKINSLGVFVFESPNFGRANQPTFKLDFGEYKRITENPIQHHKAEIERLQKFLSQYNGKVKIVELDIGNSGLSAARLCAIYQSINNRNPTEILIGVAPEYNIFSVLKRSSLVLLSGDGFYREDLKKILGLEEIPYRIIVQCQDGYIRRASEILGVSRLGDIDDDMRKWEKFYEGESILSGRKLRDYSDWFRKLTLKKIDRVKYVQQRIEQLKSAGRGNYA